MVIFNFAEKYNPNYVLGVINSKLISYWFNYTFNKFQRKIFPQFKVNELARFPIHPADKNQQRIIVELVDKIMELKKKLKDIEENSNDWEKIKSQIEVIDKKIDEEVYKLYGLSGDEVGIIEDASPKN